VNGRWSRTYRVIDGDESHPLTVTWNEPVEEAEHDWFCPITIEEPGRATRHLKSGGVDPIQAMYLGMCMVMANLLTRTDHVCWSEQDDDLGLPSGDVLRDLVEARAERYRAIRWEQELQREVIRSFENRVGRLTLNRPAALHALNTSMCADMAETLTHWRFDVAVKAVLLDHSGERGFCAGGDIRMLAESGAKDGAEAREFFFTEYRLNDLLHRYAKPVIVIMDGVTMGGGVGLSMPARYRIATERTTFAMPETGIGLFPDVGGGWYLPRLPGKAGLWLALTGARLKAADCLELGIATHFVSSDRIADLKSAIVASGGDGLDEVIAAHATDPGDAPIVARRADIDRLFAGDTVEAIFAALAADGGEWAADQLKSLKTKSPQTMKVAHRQLRAGSAMPSFAENMAMEYRIGARVVARHDFIEGVRAVIVDKDNAPRWSPDAIEGVTDAMLDEIFAPLPPGQEWTPLA